MEIERQQTVCFTGHRPEKLNKPAWIVKRALKKEIRRAIADGYKVFISGMARGVDIWAAQIVLALRNSGSDIRLVCACPCHDFQRRWEEAWKVQAAEVLAKADRIEYICESYTRFCFQKRNEWMVDRSSRVIAVFNGEPGGTKNTVDYAERKAVPVVLINS